jgi:hypothetical protein
MPTRIGNHGRSGGIVDGAGSLPQGLLHDQHPCRRTTTTTAFSSLRTTESSPRSHALAQPNTTTTTTATTNKHLALGAIMLAALYGLYLMDFILHQQTIEAVAHAFPEHRGAGQREEWGLKNRGLPAGMLPNRPMRHTRKRSWWRSAWSLLLGGGDNEDHDDDNNVKAIGHSTAKQPPLPGEAGGPEPLQLPHVPFLASQGQGGVVYGWSGELHGMDDQHLHGVVGVGADGQPLWTPLPELDWSRETLSEKRQRHAINCFNLRRSDSLPLDRILSDKRSPGCLSKVYDYHQQLPRTSVVMVFYNEPLSPLYRSVVSVLDRTPPELLHVRDLCCRSRCASRQWFVVVAVAAWSSCRCTQ